MSARRILPLMFVDLEASSLDDGSWPIEVGVAHLNEHGSPTSDSRLIRPDPAWSMDTWSSMAESIHGIRRTVLESDGHESVHVAAWFLGLANGHTLVSDAPPFDAYWLARLFDAANVPNAMRPSLVDMDGAFAATLHQAGMEAAWEHLSRTKAPHRAGPDAERMAKAWAKGLAVDAGRIPLRP